MCLVPERVPRPVPLGGYVGLFTKAIDGQTFLGILGLLVAVLGWNAADKQNKPGE